VTAGHGVFELLNVLANMTLVLRPLCHLPVMLVYDRRLNAAALRAYRGARGALLARVLPYIRPRHDDELSEYSESVELTTAVTAAAVTAVTAATLRASSWSPSLPTRTHSTTTTTSTMPSPSRPTIDQQRPLRGAIRKLCNLAIKS